MQTDPLLLANCRLYTAAVDAAPVDVLLRDGIIAEIGGSAPGDDVPILDAAGRTLAPGLIDLHVHGAGGADLMDGTPDALRTISRTLARLGTTAFLGTTFATPWDGSHHLGVAAETVGLRGGGAVMLGLHLEGPFIHPERRGGIPLSAVHAFSEDALQTLLDTCAGTLRMMTIAPEMEGGRRAVDALTSRAVIASFGHSTASYEETREGIAAGITHCTHLFNAMPGLHHREPGPLVALHESGTVTVQLISDGVHLSPPVVRFARAIFGERALCVTDGMRTAGLPEGRYRFGERDFESRDGAARYMDGTLIGTSLSLLEVAVRFARYTGSSLAEAIAAASLAPARVLGLGDRKGSVEVGKDADLILLDDAPELWATIVGGELVYRRDGAVSGPTSRSSAHTHPLHDRC